MSSFGIQNLCKTSSPRKNATGFWAMRWTSHRSLLSYKDFKLKNIAYYLLEGELSILKQLGNFLGKNHFWKIWEKLLFSLSKTILFLCLPSQNTNKHAHFQHNFLRKTVNSPDTCFSLKMIQIKLIK
jgi:hypothetical protein